MPGHLRLLLIAALAALVVGVAGAGAGSKGASTDGPALQPIGGSPEYVAGELIVRFRSGTSGAERAATLSAEGARAAGGLGLPGLTRVKLSPGVTVAEAAAALEDDPDVLYAEPNYLRRLDVLPNDPMLSQLWGLSQASDKDIDAPSAWNETTGSSSVVVAVIDSGIAHNHPDLNDNIWVNDDPVDDIDNDGNGFVDDLHGWDFVQNDETPFDYNGHGTHVAGTIGAEGNNGTGVAGVNWDVSLMAVRAADAAGSLEDADILAAINYACANGADVVNGSFGGPGFSTSIRDAINSMACANTLFVFAAGNSSWNLNGNTGTNDNTYPCEYHRPGQGDADNLICVAATGTTDALASFSNRGSLAVHLAAPGVNIRSTWPAYSNLPGFPEGFEGTATAFNARWGDRTGGAPNWNRTTQRKKAGTYSLADSPGANYPDFSDRTIRRLAPFSLAGREGCALDYWLRLDAETNFDFFIVMAGTTTATPTVVNGWSGTTGGAFFLFTEDLSGFDDEAAVYLRLRFLSDESFHYDGAYVDNLAVKCLNHGGAGYMSLSGTSMASPHVAGVAALLLADDPTMTVADLKADILAGVDTVPGLATHVSTSGRLNAAKALELVPDDVRPNTTITGRPANTTTSRKATFRFSGAGPGGRYQCKHMNGPWTACKAPKTYSGLGRGQHKFQVRSIDLNGNVDATPAVDTWRIV